MTKKNMPAWRKPVLIGLSALGIWAAPAFAQTAQSQCTSITDVLQRAKCECEQGQIATKLQTSVNVQQQLLGNGTDVPPEPFFADASNKKPGDNSSLGVSGISQSCNQLTKGAFDGFMSQAGSFFGFDIGALFGGAAGNIGGSVCQEINSAIMKRTSIACPSVQIPGFPINCSGSLSVSSSGVALNGSGQVGGYTTGGSGTVSTNGVSNGSGTYNMGQNNRGSGTVSSPQVQQATQGILSNISDNISCWLNAGPGCAR